jgi:hypothetical protein
VGEARADIQDNVPQTPVTPVSLEAVASLRILIEQDAHLQDDTSRQRLRRRLQKLTNATQLSFAERALLQDQNAFLNRINNEAKVRRSTKSEIIGTARVMSFEDLDRARTARSLKDADKAAKKARTAARKIARETARAGSGEEAIVPAAESHTLDTQMGEGHAAEGPFRAPIARMW